jgi:hypothetical protein
MTYFGGGYGWPMDSMGNDDADDEDRGVLVDPLVGKGHKSRREDEREALLFLFSNEIWREDGWEEERKCSFLGGWFALVQGHIVRYVRTWRAHTLRVWMFV